MKKETIIAIVLGVMTGVVIAVILIFNSQSNKTNDRQVISPQISTTIKLVQPNITVVKVTSPQNNSISEKDSIAIKGSAPKDSLIVVHSQAYEKIQKSVEDNFSINFPLALGENTIKITIYHQKDTEQKKLEIYYLGNE